MMYYFYSIAEVCLFSSTPLFENYKGHRDLKSVMHFFAKENFGRKGLVTRSTDGAPLRLGNTHGFATLVKKGAPHKSVTQWFLSWNILTIKSLPEILREFLSTVLKVVNFIRARVLIHRRFKKYVKKWECKVHLLHRSLPTCQSTCSKGLDWTLSKKFKRKKFKRKKAHPQNNFIYLLCGLTDLVGISGHRNE